MMKIVKPFEWSEGDKFPSIADLANLSRKSKNMLWR